MNTKNGCPIFLFTRTLGRKASLYMSDLAKDLAKYRLEKANSELALQRSLIFSLYL